MRRETTIPSDYFGPNFSASVLTNELKARGFKFLSEKCPIKFAGTVTQTQHDDGSVTFVQEGAEQ